MKRLIITVLSLIFSISFCMAQINKEVEDYRRKEAQRQQTLKEEAERHRQQEAQRQQTLKEEAERHRQAAVAQKRIADSLKQVEKQLLDQRYENAISSAQSNFSQKKYAQAKKDYETALGLKPENAAFINSKIAEIDNLVHQQEEAERERKYQDLITSAQRKLNQRQFAQAKQDYEAALKLKPENLSFIDMKMVEIERKMNEPATLYIYRKFNMQGALVGPYDVLLDNIIVACTENRGSKTEVSVKTFGNKTLSAKIEGQRDEIQINFEPGGAYYVKCSVDYRGTGRYEYKDGKREEIKKSFPTLHLVDKNVGEAEYNEMKDKKR